MKSDKVVGWSGCLIILVGLSFGLSTVGVILTFVFGGDIYAYFIDDEGVDGSSWYKFEFWVLVISIIVFIKAGGKFSKLRIFEDFPYKEDKPEEDNFLK